MITWKWIWTRCVWSMDFMLMSYAKMFIVELLLIVGDMISIKLLTRSMIVNLTSSWPNIVSQQSLRSSSRVSGSSVGRFVGVSVVSVTTSGTTSTSPHENSHHSIPKVLIKVSIVTTDEVGDILGSGCVGFRYAGPYRCTSFRIIT